MCAQQQTTPASQKCNGPKAEKEKEKQKGRRERVLQERTRTGVALGTRGETCVTSLCMLEVPVTIRSRVTNQVGDISLGLCQQPSSSCKHFKI